MRCCDQESWGVRGEAQGPRRGGQLFVPPRLMIAPRRRRHQADPLEEGGVRPRYTPQLGSAWAGGIPRLYSPPDEGGSYRQFLDWRLAAP